MASSQQIVSDPFTITFIRVKARQLCRRPDFTWSDFDDLCQDMRAYLLGKGHLFDPVRGNLEAFVTNAIKTWVAMEVRYRNRGKRREAFRAVSLDGTLVKYQGEMQPLGAVVLEEEAGRRTQAYPVSPIEEFDRREAVEHVMAKLAPEDRALVSSVAERGLRATAKALGVSWRQIANALARIRPQFANAGLGAN
jgi:DNA-directed RNA polymerase specialized sigma24 family protein